METPTYTIGSITQELIEAAQLNEETAAIIRSKVLAQAQSTTDALGLEEEEDITPDTKLNMDCVTTMRFVVQATIDAHQEEAA